MNLTRSAPATITAALAGYPTCSTDHWGRADRCRNGLADGVKIEAPEEVSMRSRILLVASLALAVLCASPVAPAVGNVEPLAPPNRTTLSLSKPMPVTFTWQALSGTGQYRFQLSRAPNFSDLLADREVGQTSTVIRDLTAGRYYWRCAGHSGEWSQTQVFTLRLPARSSSQ